MSYLDELPEDAAEMTKQAKAAEIEHCLCRWDWVADPADKDGKEFGRYQRSYPVITFAASCPVAAHAAKAGTQRHFNHWRKGL